MVISLLYHFINLSVCTKLPFVYLKVCPSLTQGISPSCCNLSQVTCIPTNNEKRYQAFPSNEILDNLKFKEAQGYFSWGRMDPNKWIPSKILWWNYLAKVINNKGGHKSNEHCRACMFSKAECVYLQNKIETLIKNKKCWLFHPKSSPVI